MSKASAFILRLYFAVIAAVTLFTLMFGTVDLLNIGLKTYIFQAADVPSYTEDCADPYKFREPINTDSDEQTEEEAFAACERRNESSQTRYEQQKASDAVRNLAIILVSLPLFILHFRIVYRDWTDERKREKAKK